MTSAVTPLYDARHVQPLVISLVFILGCVAGATTAQLVVPKARAGTNPTRWEYHCTTDAGDDLNRHPPKTLNALGAEGWELVSAAYVPQDAVFCFKRPLG